MQIDMQQRFADAQMRRRTYRKKFGQSLDHSEKNGKQVIVHMSGS
jgi:hypothetical protein